MDSPSKAQRALSRAAEQSAEQKAVQNKEPLTEGVDATRFARSSQGVGKYAGLALLLPISTLVGYGMGYGLDMIFHTGWLRYVLLVLGTVSGIIELIRELSKDL